LLSLDGKGGLLVEVFSFCGITDGMYPHFGCRRKIIYLLNETLIQIILHCIARIKFPLKKGD
jgi:hypothetical protein